MRYIKDYVPEYFFERRDKEFVFRSRWDKILYNRVKRTVETYTQERPDDECICGRVLFSIYGTGLRELLVTSDVLARLAEQKCTFSAYRISRNLYLLDQINTRKRRNFLLK